MKNDSDKTKVSVEHPEVTQSQNGVVTEDPKSGEQAELREAGNEPTGRADTKALAWPCAPSCRNEWPVSLENQTKPVKMDHNFQFGQTDKDLVLISGDNGETKGECDGT